MDSATVIAPGERSRSVVGTLLASVRHALPRGRSLPDDVWRRRHRGIVILLWAHVVGVTAFALVTGYGVAHSAFHGAVIAAAALVARWQRPGRGVRAGAASIGLVTSSAVLVHLSGGYIELHFHFFVMVGLMALYQDWLPFLLAIGYVVMHHGVAGVVDPESVYNHPGALAHPWLWATLHGVFISAASSVSLIAWRLNEHQALHDGLTNLANRSLFRDRVEHALTRRHRHRHGIAVLFLDLDDFKNVNDSLGHTAGDELLVAVGERLRACVRSFDTIARLGGDEFAILVDYVTEPEHSRQVAGRVLAELQRPFCIQGATVAISASVGIALGEGCDSVEDVVRNADVAMYAAKREGKARYAFFEPTMHAAVVEPRGLEDELARAASTPKRQFVLHSGGSAA